MEAGKERRKKVKQQCWKGDSAWSYRIAGVQIIIIGHHHIGFTLIPHTLMSVVGRELLERKSLLFWQAKSSRKWAVVMFAGNLVVSWCMNPLIQWRRFEWRTKIIYYS